jgi:hypothetical protein
MKPPAEFTERKIWIADPWPQISVSAETHAFFELNLKNAH